MEIKQPIKVKLKSTMSIIGLLLIFGILACYFWGLVGNTSPERCGISMGFAYCDPNIFYSMGSRSVLCNIIMFIERILTVAILFFGMLIYKRVLPVFLVAIVMYLSSYLTGYIFTYFHWQ
jgi:hypothetical protein